MKNSILCNFVWLPHTHTMNSYNFLDVGFQYLPFFAAPTIWMNDFSARVHWWISRRCDGIQRRRRITRWWCCCRIILFGEFFRYCSTEKVFTDDFFLSLFFSVYDNSVLRHVWRVGATPSALPPTGISLPFLNGLGDTAVDFDVGPPRTVRIQNGNGTYNGDENISFNVSITFISKRSPTKSKSFLYILLRRTATAASPANRHRRKSPQR